MSLFLVDAAMMVLEWIGTLMHMSLLMVGVFTVARWIKIAVKRRKSYAKWSDAVSARIIIGMADGRERVHSLRFDRE